MKIGFVTDFFPPVSVGGAEISAYTLARALSKRVQIEVVTIDLGPQLDEECLTVHHLRLPGVHRSAEYARDPRSLFEGPSRQHIGTGRQYISFAWQLARLAREREYSVLHVQQFHSCIAAYLSAPLHRLPIFTTVRGYRYLGPRWKDDVFARTVPDIAEKPRVARACGAMTRVKWELPRRALRKARQVIAVSEFVRQAYISAGLVHPERSTTIFNLIPAVAAPAASRADLRRRFHFRGPTALFSGRLTPGKGVHRLIEAMLHVRERLPSARLIMAGGGNVDSVQARVNARGLTTQIHLPGYVQNDTLLEMLSRSHRCTTSRWAVFFSRPSRWTHPSWPPGLGALPK